MARLVFLLLFSFLSTLVFANISVYNPHSMPLPSTPKSFPVPLALLGDSQEEYRFYVGISPGKNLSVTILASPLFGTYSDPVLTFNKNLSRIEGLTFKVKANFAGGEEIENETELRFGEKTKLFGFLYVYLDEERGFKDFLTNKVSFTTFFDDGDLKKKLPGLQLGPTTSWQVWSGNANEPIVRHNDVYSFDSMIFSLTSEIFPSQKKVAFRLQNFSVDLLCGSTFRPVLQEGEMVSCGSYPDYCIALNKLAYLDGFKFTPAASCDFPGFYQVFNYGSLEEVLKETLYLDFGKGKKYRFKLLKEDAVLDFVVVDVSTDSVTLDVSVNGTRVCIAFSPGCTISLSNPESTEAIGKLTGLAIFLERNYNADSASHLTAKFTLYDQAEALAQMPCVSLINSGSVEDKLDLVVVPGRYPDAPGYAVESQKGREEFLNAVNERVDLFFKVRGIEGILPKINVWYNPSYLVESDCSFEPPSSAENWLRWNCDYPKLLHQACPFADAVMIVVPSKIRTAGSHALVEGRSSADTFFSYAVSQDYDPGVFAHELGHLLFNLDDAYCCDGGYNHNANAYRGDCPYAESVIKNRGLSEQLRYFKKSGGYCTSFTPDKEKYPAVPKVSVLQPLDLMGGHHNLYLNFDSAFQAEKAMKNYK